MNQVKMMLKISAVLWLVWGIVHALAGIMTISNETAAAIAAIADKVNPDELAMIYPDAAGAVINQHGFNLLWGGLVTIVGAFYIWRGNKIAIFVTALVGGLLDVGYFVFIDLGGYNKFMPGTVMTIISGTAIVLSFWAHFTRKGN